MTRILQFRAYNKRHKQMVYNIAPIGGEAYITDEELMPESGMILVGPESVIEQFTGLTDKNGKEIYEGDLVVDYAGRMEKGQEDWVWTVIFENGMTNAVVETQGKRVSTITPNGILHSESLEVVGNIHENPELLK